MNDEASYRPAVSNPNNSQSTGDAKRRKTEDEHNPIQPVRAIMPGQPMPGQPMRQSYIRKVSISFGIISIKKMSLTVQFLAFYLYICSRAVLHGASG